MEENRNRKSNEKFAEYTKAIGPYVRQIMDDIKKSPRGEIQLTIKDIKELLGSEFEKKYNAEIYWALKFVLLRDYDIIVDEKNRNLLVMRMATLEDWQGLLKHGAKWQ